MIEHINQSIDLDLNNASYKVVKTTSGNSNCRFLIINITKDGEDYSIPDGVNAVVRGHRADGGTFYESTVISNNEVIIELNNNIIGNGGVSECELAFYYRKGEDDEQLLITMPFKIQAPKSPFDETAVVESKQFSALDKAIITVQGLIENVSELKEETTTIINSWNDYYKPQMDQTIVDEQQRVENENSRISAENARVDAESIRVSNEDSRVEAENNRVSVENTRIAAENLRVSAENSRVSAESDRVSAENIRVSSEEERVSAENNRVSAEDARVVAEANRVSAENIRSSSETERNNAETNRVTAENIRVANENERIENEAKRIEAEKSRETNTAEAIKNSEAATKKAEDAASGVIAALEGTIATVDHIGLSKPDGDTITIDGDGTLHSSAKGIEITIEEYNALSEEEKNNGSVYYITDIDSLEDGGVTVKEIIDNAIDDIEIGGRNLLKGTNKTGVTYAYPTSGYADRKSWTTTIPLNGDTYTLSFWAKSTVNGDTLTVYFYNPSNITSIKGSQGQTANHVDGRCDFTLSTTLTKYWVTYTIPRGGNSTRDVIIPRLFNNYGSGTITLQWEKLEEGNKVTPWTPAIEDTEAEIQAVDNKLTTNLLKPTLGTVTQNGVTCTNNGDGTYMLNGTATQKTIFIVDYTSKVPLSSYGIKKGNYYKLVGCPIGGSTGFDKYKLFLNVTGNGINYDDDGNGIIFSPTDDDLNSTYQVGIFIVNGFTASNMTFKPMITTNLNATYDDFVPYTGSTGQINSDVAEVRKDFDEHTHTKSQITDFPTSLPANGGNSDTVNGHTVESDVPVNAKFTDTVYDDSSLSSKVTQNTNDISALKTADNVLSSRIDAFTSLTQGSTTGDAELQDIRVMVNGTISDTAGNAVRTQINELKVDLGNLRFSITENNLLHVERKE